MTAEVLPDAAALRLGRRERALAQMAAHDLDVLVLGRQAGWDPARISFTGPAKQKFELRDAVESGLGELVLESLREAELADRLAAEAGRIQPVLIRIAPDRVPKGFGSMPARSVPGRHACGLPCRIDQCRRGWACSPSRMRAPAATARRSLDPA